MDFNLSLRRALKTGKVFLGQNSTRTCIDEGRAKLVVVAQNCPPEFRKFLDSVKGVPVHVFAGSGVQLGMACGKPFLSLQFDGHGNDAGILTRCEAYLDSKGMLRWWDTPARV